MSKTFTSIKKAIEALIVIEKGEKGYLEKKTNASLDSKTANAGFNNYTKYWRDINNWKLLSFSKGWAGGVDWSWCAGLQTWCFVKAFGIENAKKLLLHLPFISCATMGDKAKAAKQLHSNPKVGDIVLFYNGSRFHHTGFVYKVDSSRFYTVEGNTSSSEKVVANGGGVFFKSYSIALAKTKGHMFFRPNYSIVVKKATTKESTKSTPKTSDKKIVTVNTEAAPLCCRKKASSTAEVIGKFKKGTKLELLEKTNKTYYKVKGKDLNGKVITGYSGAKYLK